MNGEYGLKIIEKLTQNDKIDLFLFFILNATLFTINTIATNSVKYLNDVKFTPGQAGLSIYENPNTN